MPRYYFHIQDGTGRIVDDEGSEHADLDAARDEAVESARELMSQAALVGRDANHRVFHIAAENGMTLLELPFRDAIKD